MTMSTCKVIRVSPNSIKRMEISTELIREYLTKEKITSEGEKILKVKKPDYLGTSMWSFKYQIKLLMQRL